MSTAPTLNAQLIGQAERATRMVVEHLLAGTGTTFLEWAVLSLTAASGSGIERDQLIQRMTGNLKIDESVVVDTVSGLSEAQLLATLPTEHITLTGAGRIRFEEISGGIDKIKDRLYGDLPAEDLAIAARILTTVTERATAMLAGA